MATMFSPGGARAKAMQAMLASNWWAAALRGICAILIGSFAILAPGTTLLFLVMIFAAYSLVDGAFAIVLAIRGARRGEHWGRLVLNGALSIAAASIALIDPPLTAVAFGIMFAIWALVSGVTSIAAALRIDGDHGRWWLLLTGVIALVFGVLTIWNVGFGMLALSYLVGFQALFAGFAQLAFGFRLRLRDADRRGGTSASGFSPPPVQDASHG